MLSPRGDFLAHATEDPTQVGPVDHVFLDLKANSCAATGPMAEPSRARPTAAARDFDNRFHFAAY